MHLSRALRLLLVCLALVTAMPGVPTLVVRDDITATIAAPEHGATAAPLPGSRVASFQRLGSATAHREFALTVAEQRAIVDRVPARPAFLLNCSWLC